MLDTFGSFGQQAAESTALIRIGHSGKALPPLLVQQSLPRTNITTDTIDDPEESQRRLTR